MESVIFVENVGRVQHLATLTLEVIDRKTNCFIIHNYKTTSDLVRSRCGAEISTRFVQIELGGKKRL